MTEIPQEWVEKAALALDPEAWGDADFVAWDVTSRERRREAALNLARAVLAAVLPAVRRTVAEQAWREGYQDGWSDRAHPGEDITRNPYREGGDGS